MTKRNMVLAGGAVVLILVLGAGGVYAWQQLTKQEVSMQEPVDVVHTFYMDWLAAAQSTTTNPYDAGLADYKYLSKTLRDSIKSAHQKGGLDPVLCQDTVPANISERVVYQGTEGAEMLVTARKSTSPQGADVKLVPLNGGWYINTISCSAGDVPPEREFSFDREGSLLKTDQLKLNPQYWYIVFEEDGQKGHYAPIFFNAASVCVDLGGKTGACNPDSLRSAMTVHVQGEMSETGITVKRLEMKQ